MVFDKIENARIYYGLGRGIETVLKYYESYKNSDELLPECIKLDGDRIFLLGNNYETTPMDDTQLEAHRLYVDVMFMIEGEERFYYKPISDAKKITMEYEESQEACLAALDGDEAQVHFKAGCFAIFFPQDGHCAGRLWDKPSKVKKFIAKVAMTSL